MAQPSSAPSSGAAGSFESLLSYPFHTDPEFANGLAIILGHPGTPATEAEMNREDDLVLQAKCFFYSRYSVPSISTHDPMPLLISRMSAQEGESHTAA